MQHATQRPSDTASALGEATHALEQATRDVAEAFARCAPYLDASGPQAIPLADWTGDHFALLLHALVGHDTQHAPLIQRWMREDPAFVLSLTATVARFGYAIALHEREQGAA